MVTMQAAPSLDNQSAVLRTAKVKLKEGRISLERYMDIAHKEVGGWERDRPHVLMC